MPRADRCVPLLRKRVVIEHHTFASQERPAPFELHLCMPEGEQTALTWLAPWAMARDELVDVADVTLVRCEIGLGMEWIATEIRHEPEAPVLELIPDTFGADPDIVQRLRDVVGCIRSDPLIRLIERIFIGKQVFRTFWTCPASRAHHHADQGGLAQHSIEMAESIAFNASLNGTDRDLGIACALLHDIGKLWCHGEEASASHRNLGHELVGLLQLADDLDLLEREWPDGATAMRALLAGRWALRNQRPLLAVGKLVQAEDQMSVERDLRRRPDHRHEPWMPKPSSARSNVHPFPDRG